MNCWPTPEQLLLLQSSLLDVEQACTAWEEYTRRVDLQALDYASTTLLPRVYSHLKDQKLSSEISARSLKRCKSIYRKTWAENHLAWAKLLPVFSQLLEAGADKIILLKGMAMMLRYYRDFGVRVIGDVDILIAKEQLPIAIATLSSSEWISQLHRLDIQRSGPLSRWHSANFLHKTGLNLDVHWSLMLESLPLVDRAVLENSEFHKVNNLPLHIASPTHLFLQTCVHGTKKSSIPLIRWIPDAMTLLKDAAINWDELLYLAKSSYISLPLCLALQYLVDHFQAPVPPSLLNQLKAAPLVSAERREYRANLRGNYRLAGWYRYCLKQGYLTLGKQFSSLPRYLQNTARLKAAWQLPFFVIYWIFRQLLKCPLFNNFQNRSGKTIE